MKDKKLRILILEDSHDDYLLLLRELKKGSFEIEHALVENAIEFENALLQNWDVIISDYSLPTFTGYDALKICTKKEIDTPFIMVSGTVGEDIAVQMMKLGAKDYIMKNSLARLLPAVEREIEDAQIRKERKQAETALKVSEQLYRNLFSQSHEGLLLMTLDGIISDVNLAFARMHGYTIEELINFDIKEIQVHKKNPLEDHTEIFHLPLENEVVRADIEHLHRDGHKIPLSVTISRFYNNGEFFLGFFQDITERKQVAAAIKAKMDNMELFNDLSVGRELKMIELKKEINELLKKMGSEKKYEIFT